MNREIRFRAWQDNQMLYQDKCGVYGTKHFLDKLYEDCELMQYTNLKDKHGKPIFEGDIVQLDSWAGVQQICFIEGAFCLANKEGKYVGDIHYVHHAGINQCTILGNVFENPELINKPQP